jgi:hypothetical protein
VTLETFKQYNLRVSWNDYGCARAPGFFIRFVDEAGTPVRMDNVKEDWKYGKPIIGFFVRENDNLDYNDHGNGELWPQVDCTWD